jgi:hypothetical protein
MLPVKNGEGLQVLQYLVRTCNHSTVVPG